VAVIWLVAGILLAVAELVTVDLVLIMLAAGAIGASISAAVGAPVLIQVLVFAVVSVFGLAAVRPAIKRRLHRNADHTPMGVEALEGTEAVVVEQVTEGAGMVKMGGELWSARSYDASQVMEPGSRVRVVEVKGATALVWKE
jgi:membrane protein implicated in regulation of membrane protease activity